MAIVKTIEAGDSRPALEASRAGDLVTVPVEFDIAVDNKGVALATGDILELCKIPAGHVVNDVRVDCDAIAAGVVNVGLVDEAGAVGTEFMEAEDVGTAALIYMTKAGSTRVAPLKETEQVLAMEFTTGSAAVTGVIRATVQYRPDHFDI